MSHRLEVKSSWATLRDTYPHLPAELRDPQIDTLYWLSQKKHVIVCIGTGESKNKSSLRKISHFNRDHIHNKNLRVR